MNRDASEGLVLEEGELFGEFGRLEVVEDERHSSSGRRRTVSTQHRAATTAAAAARTAAAAAAAAAGGRGRGGRGDGDVDAAARRMPHRQAPHPVVRRTATSNSHVDLQTGDGSAQDYVEKK